MPGLPSVVVQAVGQMAVYTGARWTMKVTLVASVFAAYLACYASFLVAFSLLVGQIPPMPSFLHLSFLLQFFPSRDAIAFASSAIFGSLAVRKACAYFVKALANTAKIGA